VSFKNVHSLADSDADPQVSEGWVKLRSAFNSAYDFIYIPNYKTTGAEVSRPADRRHARCAFRAGGGG